MTAPVPAGIVEAAAKAIYAHRHPHGPRGGYTPEARAVLAVVLPMVADEIDRERRVGEDDGGSLVEGWAEGMWSAAHSVRSLAEGLGDE